LDELVLIKYFNKFEVEWAVISIELAWVCLSIYEY